MSNFISELQAIAAKAGSSQPIGNLIKNLDVAAVLSKAVKPRDMGRQEILGTESESFGVNTGVDKISKSIIARLEDNENMYQLFPDIELAIQIIVGSIMSPKDMVKSDLIYQLKNSDFPATMVTELIEIVREEIKKHYGLLDELPTIIRDALFDRGSHVKAVLPESAVDELINGHQKITMESMYSNDIFYRPLESPNEIKVAHIGILGDPRPAPVDGPKGRIMAMESALNHVASTTYNPKLYVEDFKNRKIVDGEDELIVMEKFLSTISDNLEICDNPNLLKLPNLYKQINKQKIDNFISVKPPSTLVVATENYAIHDTTKQPQKKLSPKELGEMIYKETTQDYTPLRVLPGLDSLKRKSIGRPLILDIPSEAAIPIHIPGKPKEHIGYFFPIDIDGNFITLDSTTAETGQGLSSFIQSDKNGYNASALLTEKARQNLVGSQTVPMIDHMSDLYAEIIEKDMLTRFSKGSYGRKFEVARNNEIYRIMMIRALQMKFTRLLYVPAEYVTYFAFNYHRNGVGKSYLDKLSNITSLRAMVVFSKVIAAVKSSIETTHVNVTLDPRDGDPIKTMEMAKHFVAKSRQQYFPHGLNRVADLTDWITRAGIQLTFEGHPKLPTTKFDFESKNIQHVPPDEGLEELFRKQSYMHFGISPDAMDTAVGSDFATSVEKNSVLFTKRIMVLSDQLSIKMSEYVSKIIKCDQTIQARLIEVFKAHQSEIEKRLTDEERQYYSTDATSFTKDLISSFADSLVVDLPKPETIQRASQKTAIADYEELIDKVISYVFSAEILPQELGGESTTYVDALKLAWKGALMRQFFADNNIAPEVFKIADVSEDGKGMANLLELITNHTKAVMLNINGFLDKMKATKNSSDKTITAINPGESSGGSSGGGSSWTDNSSGGGFGGGGDEFGSPGNDELGGGSGEENPFDEVTNLATGDNSDGSSSDTPPEGGEETPPNE